MSKAVKTSAQKKKIFCKERISVRVDADNCALLNASAERVKWKSLNHAINTAIRESMQVFAPEGCYVRIDPFQQLTFANAVRENKRRK